MKTNVWPHALKRLLQLTQGERWLNTDVRHMCIHIYRLLQLQIIPCYENLKYLLQCLLSLNLYRQPGTRWRSVVSFMLQPQSWGKSPHTHWVGPRPGLDTVEKRKISCSCQESNPDSSAIQSIDHHCTD
jgi:hypothetical protein